MAAHRGGTKLRPDLPTVNRSSERNPAHSGGARVFRRWYDRAHGPQPRLVPGLSAGVEPARRGALAAVAHAGGPRSTNRSGPAAGMGPYARFPSDQRTKTRRDRYGPTADRKST